MKDYIVAENKQLKGTAEPPQTALQIAQNTRDIAELSINFRELSGEVHDVREHVGKIYLNLQMLMKNFIAPTTYKHFLIYDGQKLESDVVYAKIYSRAKKSIMIIDNYPR